MAAFCHAPRSCAGGGSTIEKKLQTWRRCGLRSPHEDLAVRSKLVFPNQGAKSPSVHRGEKPLKIGSIQPAGTPELLDRDLGNEGAEATRSSSIIGPSIGRRQAWQPEYVRARTPSRVDKIKGGRLASEGSRRA